MNIAGFGRYISLSRSVGMVPHVPSVLMSFYDQSRSCHPERSEGSSCAMEEILSGAKDDIAEFGC